MIVEIVIATFVTREFVILTGIEMIVDVGTILLLEKATFSEVVVTAAVLHELLHHLRLSVQQRVDASACP